MDYIKEINGLQEVHMVFIRKEIHIILIRLKVPRATVMKP